MLKGRQILIPQSMQKEILQQLHQGHQGVEKTRRLARDTVYWVNINRDIEVICKSWHACQENQVINTKEPRMPHTPPTRPLGIHRVRSVRDQWQAVPTDSGPVYEIPTGRLHAQSCQQSCGNREDEVVLCYVWPDEIMTDGGIQYSGKQFKEFTKNWGICHTMSSPHYPMSNGFIERHIRHVKPIIGRQSETVKTYSSHC